MMEEYWWVREVNEIAAQDPWHQKLTQALHEQAAPFQRLCEKLPSQDTEILMDYISAVEELGYSRMLLAYDLGFAHGKKSTVGFI